MRKIKIAVVCSSGIATAMHVAYKLKNYLNIQNLNPRIDCLDSNHLPERIEQYDITVSNIHIDFKTSSPIFNATPFITGIDEKLVVDQIIEKIQEIQTL